MHRRMIGLGWGTRASELDGDSSDLSEQVFWGEGLTCLCDFYIAKGKLGGSSQA